MQKFLIGLALLSWTVVGSNAHAATKPSQKKQTDRTTSRTSPEPKLLNVGDPAPPLKVGKWVKGKPVEGFVKGRVYVVEFWATWCGAACRMASLHMGKLATKYQGKVTFIGVSVRERIASLGLHKEAILAKVEKAVEKMGDGITYSVATDDPGNDGEDDNANPNANFMAKNWWEAAGESGVPLVFVVGADSKIAWIGDPYQLDGVLNDIVGGKFENAKLAAERLEKKQKGLLNRVRNREIMERIQKPQRAGKFKEALEELEKVATEYPSYKETLAITRLNLLLKTDEAKAYAYARELANGDYKGNALSLLGLAQAILNADSLRNPDYRMALLWATKANELSDSIQGIERVFIFDKIPHLKVIFLATLAKAQFKNGDAAQAVKTMEKTMAECQKIGDDVPGPLRKELESQLEKYRKAAAQGGAAAPRARPY